MENIEKIRLVFENCEVMDITRALGDFKIDDITYTIGRIATNAFSKACIGNHVQLHIFGDGDFSRGDQVIMDDINPIERIKNFSDITAIELTYSDGKVEDVYVDYSDDTDILLSHNPYQTVKEVQGDLFIVINKNKKVEDVYTDEYIEELIGFKSFYMLNDVAIKNTLSKDNWNIVFDNDNYFQIYKDYTSIVISSMFTNISFFKNYRSFIIPNKEMVDLCSLIFDTTRYSTRCNEESYKNIKIIFNKDKLIKLELHDNNNELIECELNIDTKTIKFDDREISSELICDLESIIFTYLPDNFWESYRR